MRLNEYPQWESDYYAPGGKFHHWGWSLAGVEGNGWSGWAAQKEGEWRVTGWGHLKGIGWKYSLPIELTVEEVKAAIIKEVLKHALE